MQDNFKTAQSSFNATLSFSENQLKSKAMYNLGNISYKNQKLDEALSFYRKALELNPEDDEARYNYEFIKYQKNPPEDKEVYVACYESGLYIDELPRRFPKIYNFFLQFSLHKPLEITL